jgi:hypothetical protein
LADAELPRHLGKRAGIAVIRTADPALGAYDGADPPPAAGPRDVAYVLYSPGPDGHPKGVMVEHRSLVNYVDHLARTWDLEPDDVAFAYFPHTVDGTLADHAIGLLSGHTMCLLPPEVTADPKRFRSYLAGRGVTCGFLPPSYLAGAELPDTVRIVSTGGAVATPAVVARAGTGVAYVNSYGPTEATAVATEWRHTGCPIPDPVPIGRPIANVGLYILDGDRLCGIGMPGELCISGVGVARGYLGRPEANAQRFPPNPFGPGRLHRTGDLARWDLDGNVLFLGRLDQQVKILGYRIDPAEIETRMRRYPGVAEAAVIAREGPDGPSLEAYYVAATALDPAGLRAHLAAHLPAHMVPAAFRQVASLGGLGGRPKPGHGGGPVAAAAPPRSARPLDDAAPRPRPSPSVPTTPVPMVPLGPFPAAPATGGRVPAGRVPSGRVPAARVPAAPAVPAPSPAPPTPARRRAVPQLPPTDLTGLDIDALVAGVTRAANDHAQRIQATAGGLEYPLSPAQRLARALGRPAPPIVVDIDHAWDPDRFARVWRVILTEHPILCSVIDPASAEQRELDQTAWGGSGIVHVDLTGYREWTARRVTQQLARRLGGLIDPAAPSPSHRLITVARPGGLFTVIVPITALAFDQTSREILARRLMDGYAVGWPAPAERLPYSDYLRFAALGPRDVTDAEIVRELDLERFAEAAAAQTQPGATVDLEHDLGPDAPAEAVGFLVEDALIRANGGRGLPLFLLQEGRRYADADFTGHIGQFDDLVPLTVDPANPGLFAAADRRIAFLHRTGLTVTGILADPLIAARYPMSAGIIGDAWPGLPILNLAAASEPAHRSAGPPLIEVRHDGVRLVIRGLPCRDPGALGVDGPDTDGGSDGGPLGGDVSGS